MISLKSTTWLIAIISCCMSDSCQTIYYNRWFFMIKVCRYKITDDCFWVLCNLGIQCFYLFRSQANDNCLFSTFSMVLCRDNRYLNGLRILAAIEFCLISDFYREHASFISLSDTKHWNVFIGLDTRLAASVSHNALDQYESSFKKEAVSIFKYFF